MDNLENNIANLELERKLVWSNLLFYLSQKFRNFSTEMGNLENFGFVENGPLIAISPFFGYENLGKKSSVSDRRHNNPTLLVLLS